MNEDIRSRRITYDRGTLDVDRVAAEPFEQFRAWLDDALHAEGDHRAERDERRDGR